MPRFFIYSYLPVSLALNQCRRRRVSRTRFQVRWTEEIYIRSRGVWIWFTSGPLGHSVQAGELIGQHAALHTAVQYLYLGGVAILLCEHLYDQRAQRRILPELPAG